MASVRGETGSAESTLLRLAVLYADVSGSTRLYEQFGDAVALSDISTCLQLLSGVASAWEGRTIKTIGDEVMCVFNLPAQAARAAVEMHRALDEAGSEGKFGTGALTVKIGWHYGAAGWRHGELEGEAPVVAQQIIGKAKAREILTSEAGLAFLSADERDRAQPIDTVESALDGNPIGIVKIPWEEGEDVTQFQAGAAEAPASVHKALVLLQRGGDTLTLNESRRHCRIGRTEDNDLQVGGPYTSRHHAEINYRRGRFYIRDDSINGTLVRPRNGDALHLHREENVLDDEGTITFGVAPGDTTPARVRYFCRAG